MVLLRYLVPFLGVTVLILLGLASPVSLSSPLGMGWEAMALIYCAIIFLDRSRGNWISYLLSFLFFIFTLGLYVKTPEIFYSWTVCIFIFVSLIAILTHTTIPIPVKFIVPMVFGMLPLLPAVLSGDVAQNDEASVALPIAAMIAGLIPFGIQFSKITKDELVWPLLSMQQTFIRLGYIVWCYQWKATFINTDIAEFIRAPLVILVLFLFVITNITFRRVNWAYVVLSAYTLIIIFIASFRDEGLLPFLMAVVAVSAYGSIAPLRQGKTIDMQSILACLEMGGFGGGLFLMSLWALFKVQTHMDTAEFVIWALFLFLCSAKIWGQSNSGKLTSEPVPITNRYTVSRFLVQMSVLAYFVALLLKDKIASWIG